MMVTKELILSASDSYILRNNDCGFSLSYLLLHRDLILGSTWRHGDILLRGENGGGGGGGINNKIIIEFPNGHIHTYKEYC